jgi:CRISPR-associated protein Cas2
MTVIILERVPASVRGELTRWMLEPKTGVFVGRVSAMVRDKLWEHICRKMRGGAGMMVHTADTEQGYAIRYWGETSRKVEDFEGLTLIKVQ